MLKLFIIGRLSMWHWIECHILGNHDWTCAAGEGIPPTDEQLHGGIEGFYSYAKMYCKRCGIESQRSIEERIKRC
jgi:hypothetical protein